MDKDEKGKCKAKPEGIGPQVRLLLRQPHS